jgi:hypothetical protein
MRIGIIILLMLSSEMAFSQAVKITDEQFNQSGAVKLIYIDSKEAATEIAENDIKNGLPFLLLQSGISPVSYPDDYKFEETFEVHYFDLVCTGPKQEYVIAYNKRIFSYLSESFGSKWKRKVRKDVIGLRK